jgi:hypothetical protein
VKEVRRPSAVAHKWLGSARSQWASTIADVGLVAAGPRFGSLCAHKIGALETLSDERQ